MLLKNVKIESYRSLNRIEMKDIDNLVILVGKNSSGKTNLLEAIWLFFKDFSLVPETVAINSPLDANEHLWFEGNTEVPITFIIEIELNERESKRVFSTDFLQLFNEKRKFLVTIERQIVATPPNMSWKTVRLDCNSALFIENGKLVAKTIEIEKSSNPNSPTPKTSQKGKESTKAVRVVDKSLSDQKKYLGSLQPQDIQKIATNIQNEIREKVKYIQAARSKTSTLSNYGVRTTTTDDTTNQKIVQMGENLSTKVRRR